MSRCDLQIVFDRANRSFRSGEEIIGSVHVQVNQDVHCDGLIVEHFWQTHGQGNTDRGPKESGVVFQGDWRAGESRSYPFRFVAPGGPPTYHGHYLNVDHYVHARVDIPWAIDPKHKEEYVLLPGEAEYGNLPPAQGQGRQVTRWTSRLGLPIGVAMIVGGILFFLPCGIVLIPLGCLVLFFALRRSLAERRLGNVEVRLGPLRVAPGGSVPLELSFTPRHSTALGGIRAKLLAVEQCVSGSGTDRTTHTHKLHEHTVTLAGQGQLAGGQEVHLRAAVPIPQTNALSFSASDNKLIWSLELRIDVPLWPDWVEERVLTVRPGPAVGPAKEQPGAPPLPVAPPAGLRTAAVEESESGGMTVSMGSEATYHQPPPEPPIEAPAETAAPREPPPVAASTDSALLEVIDRLSSAKRYGSQRDEIVAEHAEESFACSLEIDRIEKTYSYLPEKRFREGHTVTGRISGTDCEASLQLPEERNQELGALGPGDTLRADCRLIKWNNVYDRLEMRQA